MLAPAFAAPLIFANLARALSKSALRNIQGQCGDTDDHCGEAIERGGKGSDDAGLVAANKLRAKLIEGIARARRGDHGSAWPHLDGIGEARVVSVRSAEIFEPVQRRFRHVSTDAVSAAIELVADQDAAARATIGGPPANAVTRLLE